MTATLPAPAPASTSTSTCASASASTPASVPAPTPTGPTVAAGPDWDVGGQFPAVAAAADGALVLRRAEARWALADVTTGPTFSARVETTFTSGAGFGVLLGASTDAHGRIDAVSVDVDPFDGGIVLRRWSGGHRHWRPLAAAPVPDPTALYGPHTLAVTVADGTLTVRLDDDEALRTAWPPGVDDPPPTGDRIGVHAWSTTEVRVERLVVGPVDPA